MAIAHGQQPRGDRRDRQRTDGSLELPEGRLRGQPYRNAPSTQFRGGPGSSLARFNLQLANVLTSGKMNIATGLRIACEMKEAGIRPDLTTFHHLLRGFAHHGLFTEAVACVDEMERLGIVPDQHAFHYILQVR
jgi:pentatricopeptide repeat protein